MKDYQPIFPSHPVSHPAIEGVNKTKELPPAPLAEKEKLIKSVNNQLTHPAKIPYMTWEQTEDVVTISISAADVKDYYLKVGLRSVQFR